MTANKSLQATNLSCMRQGTRVFHQISLQVNAGEILLIRGENGAGKSSLLRLLAGIATPATGDITWRGASIYAGLTHYQRQIHFLGHQNGLQLALSVSENLKLQQILAGSGHKANMAIIEQLRLQNKLQMPARLLSAGQKRRLALIRLFMFERACWILDEPFTSLDAYTHDLFVKHLDLHLARGGMCVLASHLPHDFPHRTCSLGMKTA